MQVTYCHVVYEFKLCLIGVYGMLFLLFTDCTLCGIKFYREIVLSHLKNELKHDPLDVSLG